MTLETIRLALLLASPVIIPGPSTSVTSPATLVKATATVTNNNTLDVDVFVLAGGTKYRLGTVVTSQTREFDLPAQAMNAGPVRVSAEPIGARSSYTSDPLTIADGDRIRLNVSPQLPQSTVTVERGGS